MDAGSRHQLEASKDMQRYEAICGLWAAERTARLGKLHDRDSLCGTVGRCRPSINHHGVKHLFSRDSYLLRSAGEGAPRRGHPNADGGAYPRALRRGAREAWPSYAGVLVRLSTLLTHERGLAVALPVILPDLPLDALGHIPPGAEAGYDRSPWTAEPENLRVRALQTVAGREGRLTFWSECSPRGGVPKALHDERLHCLLLQSIRLGGRRSPRAAPALHQERSGARGGSL